MGPLLALSFWALANAQQFAESPTVSPLDVWMTKLELCESGGQDVRVLDTNNKYSYGYFQFQMDTFNRFGLLYHLDHSDIHSRPQQYAIAKAMVSDGLWKHWYNCGKKIGLPPVTVE